MNDLKLMAERVMPIVSMPDLDQNAAIWRPDGKCCVGARLAHALNVESGRFMGGANAFAESIGASLVQLILMLRAAGAPYDPFGIDEWQTGHPEIFRRLAKIETLPETRNAHVPRIFLINMKVAGANLANANFNESDLYGADPSGANLQGATFTKADMPIPSSLART